ncbi:MAG: hypothetical protein JNM27_21970 [Leptospirales bacterium]|nr:hypothetical protein [Leptospirales bacterium]
MNRLSLLLFVLVSLIVLSHCTPSALIERKYVTYNFRDEGFLSPRMIQTVGKSSYAPGELTVEASRVHCSQNALSVARDRMLRVFIHTKFNLKGKGGSGTSGFDRDYPAAMSERELLRAETDFGPLIDRGYIALQDVRAADSCSIVYRLEGEDLSKEIRSVETTFQPRTK